MKANSTDFYYRNLCLSQSHATHKITTDSLLLGSYTPSQWVMGDVIDLGAGTGVVGLLACELNSKHVKSLSAVEIDRRCEADLSLNYQRNLTHLPKQMYMTDWLDFFSSLTYDTILCNPPYFEGGKLNSDRARTRQRYFDIRTWFDRLKPVIKPTSTIHLILPTEFAPLWIENALLSGLKYIHRLTFDPKHFSGKKGRTLLTFSPTYIAFTHDIIWDWKAKLTEGNPKT